MNRNTIEAIRFDEMNRNNAEMLRDIRASMEEDKELFFDSYLRN